MTSGRAAEPIHREPGIAKYGIFERDIRDQRLTHLREAVNEQRVGDKRPFRPGEQQHVFLDVLDKRSYQLIIRQSWQM